MPRISTPSPLPENLSYAKKAAKALVRFGRWCVSPLRWVGKRVGLIKTIKPVIRAMDIPLGAGSFGSVSEVEFEGTRLARKKPISSYETEELIKEQKILSTLNHPHIIKSRFGVEESEVVVVRSEDLNDSLEKTGSSDEAEYVNILDVNEEPTGLVMEKGSSSLTSSIEKKWRGGMNASERHKHAYNLLSAIAYLHKQKLSHLDLKPDNILLVEGEVKISDFGSAIKVPTEHSYSLTYKSPEGMTRRYMAPEMLGLSYQMSDTKVYESADPYQQDVHSMGMVLAELLTGVPIASHREQVFEGEITEDGTQVWVDKYLKRYAGGLDPKITEILHDMLKGDPNQRISSSEALSRFPKNPPRVSGLRTISGWLPAALRRR
ncbi:protein kinase [Endozoicomonas sp. OPT23]|uniref:protein kinase domain-containing protein n=1 Tax=Endozoicomonas sp. OPT23 TaxID=2072845 RepID=UPI001891E6AC|nr:protein kinase [Endozoicomonas sp. OPT23]